MCGTVSEVEVDPVWPDEALDSVADLLATVRCDGLGLGFPTPLAFNLEGRAVQVQDLGAGLVVRPVTPHLLALDIVMHVCRPVRGRHGRYGVPTKFPLALARAFLDSDRVGLLPKLELDDDSLTLGWCLLDGELVAPQPLTREQIVGRIVELSKAHVGALRGSLKRRHAPRTQLASTASHNEF